MKYSPYEIFVQEQWSSRREAKKKFVGYFRGEPIYADENDGKEELRDKFIMTTGLAGETGEVVELLKKEVRDGKLDTQELALELGDVLYYLTMIANRNGFTLEQLQRRNVHKLELRNKLGKKNAKEVIDKYTEEYWRTIDGSENEREA